jgi:hypothetical protein
VTTGSRAASKQMLQSNWVLPFGLIQMGDSSPEEQSGVARGEATRAEVSVDLNGCSFLMSRGVL